VHALGPGGARLQSLGAAGESPDLRLNDSAAFATSWGSALGAVDLIV
jgi:hypothetical protein